MPSAPASRTIGSPPTVDEAVGRLGALFGRVRLLVASLVDELANAADLTAAQLGALLAVEGGATGVSAVAQQTLTHLSSASRTVDVLVRAGLVDRSEDPADRRAVRLSLTTDGRRRCRDVHVHRDRLTGDAMADFSTSERQHLVDLLERLVLGLESTVAVDD